MIQNQVIADWAVVELEFGNFKVRVIVKIRGVSKQDFGDDILVNG